MGNYATSGWPNHFLLRRYHRILKLLLQSVKFLSFACSRNHINPKQLGPSRLTKEKHRISRKPARKAVEGLSIFYRYFHGHCSLEIRKIIPDPVRRVRTTRSSTQSHPFQVMLPNPRTLAHKSSFVPRTSQLWNSLPSTAFPESYNLSCFKSNVNKLDLISFSI